MMQKLSLATVLVSLVLGSIPAFAIRDTGWEPPGLWRKQLEQERRERERLKQIQDSREAKRAARRKSGLVKSTQVKVMRFESSPDFLSGQMTATVNHYGNGEYELQSLRIELSGQIEATHDLSIDDLNKGYTERKELPVLGNAEMITLTGDNKLEDQGGEIRFRFVSDFKYGLKYGSTRFTVTLDKKGNVFAASAWVPFDEMVFGVRMRSIPFGPAGEVGVGIKEIRYRFQGQDMRQERF